MRRPASPPLFLPAAAPEETSRTTLQLGDGIAMEAWIAHHGARPQDRLPARSVVTLSLAGGGRAERAAIAERLLARALEVLSEPDPGGLASMFTLLTRPAPPPQPAEPQHLEPVAAVVEILPPDPPNRPDEPIDPYEQPFVLAMLS